MKPKKKPTKGKKIKYLYSKYSLEFSLSEELFLQSQNFV